MTLEKFDVLEEKVRQLSEKFSLLRDEKETIALSMQDMEQQINDLQNKNRSLEEEREQMRARLDKVISSLENVSLNI